MDKTSLENDPVFELFSKHWLGFHRNYGKAQRMHRQLGKLRHSLGKTGEERPRRSPSTSIRPAIPAKC